MGLAHLRDNMGRTVSGLLDGLLAKVPDASYALDELTGTQAYEWALNDVREALRSEATVRAVLPRRAGPRRCERQRRSCRSRCPRG